MEGAAMHLTDAELKFVGYGLTFAYVVCFVMLPVSGFLMRPPPSSSVTQHRRWMHASWIVTLVLITALEGLVLPRFGRHYDAVTYWHWAFDAIFVVFWLLAVTNNGLRALKKGRSTTPHKTFGYITSAASLGAAFLGIILIHRLC